MTTTTHQQEYVIHGIMADGGASFSVLDVATARIERRDGIWRVARKGITSGAFELYPSRYAMKGTSERARIRRAAHRQIEAVANGIAREELDRRYVQNRIEAARSSISRYENELAMARKDLARYEAEAEALDGAKVER